MNCCKAKAQAPGVCWDRVKRGFASLERLYGGTNYERNALAFMAVRQGIKNLRSNFSRASATIGIRECGAAKTNLRAAKLR